MLPEFEMKLPATLPEALRALAETPNIAPVAGGTNLVVDLRSGRHHPAALINIAALPELQGINLGENCLTIGAGVTLTALLESGLIADHAPVLRQAAAVFANPLVRNRATLGGNLGDASPAADTAPALLVMDAEVILESLNGGMRTVAIDDFFVGVRKTARRPDELITAVRLPLLPAHSAANFYKLGLRKADAISVVGVAARLTRDEAGNCTEARIALGSVAPRPLRAHAAEELLIGKPLTAEAIAEAARLAAEAASPISDVRASADYRRHTAGVLARRLLAQAADQIK